MHGRKQLTAPLPAEVLAATAKKVAGLRKLSAAAFANKAGGVHTPAALALNATVLAAVPDVLSLWNHRREALCAEAPAPNPEQLAPPPTPPTLPAWLPGELAVTQAALTRSPKSYPAWHHRKWALTRGCAGLPPEVTAPVLAEELALTGAMLQLDGRNFHCWGHRAWVAGVARVPAAAELEFTSSCIAANFSNYSAWHARARLLREVHGVPLPVAVLASELTLLRTAVYTEPDDQSPWVYRRWVVAQLLRGQGGEGGVGMAAVAVAAEEEEGLRALVEAEPGCVWPLRALAEWLAARGSPEAPRVWERLRVMDPVRSASYGV